MKNKKMRLVCLLLTLVMVFGMFAGCGKTTAEDPVDPTKPVDTPKTAEGLKPAIDKDTIVIATMGETPSVSPTEHNAVAGDYINKLTYNSLYKGDMELNAVPDLVKDMKVLSETEFEFELKPNVKFHDNTVMTADDVVASLMWAKGFSQISLYNNCVQKVEKTGDLKVKITTPEPYANLLSDLSHHGNSIVPKALIDSGNDFNKNPIGTGPYVFKKWVMGDKLVFEAFPDYFDGAAKIKNIEWKTIPEGSSRTIALEAGEIDFIIEVEAMDADRLRNNAKVSLLEYHATNETWLMLNNEKPGLDNSDVRHAINSAVDKDSVIQVAYNGNGVAAYSQSPNNMPGASDENADKYDVAKAKEFLAKSGYKPEDVKFSIICSDDTKKRAAEVVQANLKENLGINCEIESMDLATYLSVTTEGNFTASIGGYSSSTMLSYMIGVYHSASINASNKTRTVDKEVDALIDEASRTIDAAAREKVLKKCAARLNSICPQVPLYQPISMRAFNANLEGVEVSASGTLYFNQVSWKA